MNTLGNEAEKVALNYLLQQGLRLISKNYQTKFGEIDLIMQDDKSIVFIEVRFRKNNAFGGAIESITTSKQHKIAKVAEQFLQQYGNQACRFDAIVMDKPDVQHIQWIKHAFEV
jgi:putative endonuclease